MWVSVKSWKQDQVASSPHIPCLSNSTIGYRLVHGRAMAIGLVLCVALFSMGPGPQPFCVASALQYLSSLVSLLPSSGEAFLDSSLDDNARSHSSSVILACPSWYRNEDAQKVFFFLIMKHSKPRGNVEDNMINPVYQSSAFSNLNSLPFLLQILFFKETKL